jgi:hypothetical protein
MFLVHCRPSIASGGFTPTLSSIFLHCRPSIASVGYMAFWAFYVGYLLLMCWLAYITLVDQEKELDPMFIDCSDWGIIVFDLSVVLVFACIIPKSFVERIHRLPTLRVSPRGWSLQFWPQYAKQSSLLRLLCFGMMEEDLGSDDAEVHGAKVWASTACSFSILLSSAM